MFIGQRTHTISHVSPANNKLASTRAYEGSRQDISSKSPRNFTLNSNPSADRVKTMPKNAYQPPAEYIQQEWNEIVVMIGQERYRIDVSNWQSLQRNVQGLMGKKMMGRGKTLGLKIIILDRLISRRPELAEVLENVISEYTEERIKQMEVI